MTDWITTHEAAELAGYHPRHVGRLIRAGKIEARKWGTLWQVKRTSVLAYVRQVEKTGAKRGRKPIA